MTSVPFEPALDQAIEEAISRKSVDIAHGLSDDSNNLLSVELRAKQIEHEMRSACIEYQATCFSGMKYCMEELQEIARQDASCNLESIYTKLHDGFNQLKKNLSSSEVETTQSAMGLDNQTCMFLYKAAAKMLKEEKYEQAAASFQLLVTLNHGCAVCWLCLGHANFFLEKYLFAASCYRNAFELDDTSCVALIHEAECYEKLNEIQQAVAILEEAKVNSKVGEEFDEVIAERLDALKNKRGAL